MIAYRIVLQNQYYQTMKKYGAVKKLKYGAQHIHALAQRTPRNQPLLEHTTTKTHTHTIHKPQNNTQHCHHGPPKLPASNGSNFTGECNHGMLHDRSQSLQHGYVFLIDYTNFSFIYLTINLCAAAQRPR